VTDNDGAARGRKYLASLRGRGIDTLVLGCTHYPLLKSVISKAVGPGDHPHRFSYGDAKEVVEVLEKLRWRGNGRGEGIRKFYVTDSPRFERSGNGFSVMHHSVLNR
jgi:glutamate racemase